MSVFLERKTTVRQIHLAGGEGWRNENNLALRALLAVRQILALAERGMGRQSRTLDLEFWFWDLSLREPSDPLGHKVGQKAKTCGFSREIHPSVPIARYGPEGVIV